MQKHCKQGTYTNGCQQKFEFRQPPLTPMKWSLADLSTVIDQYIFKVGNFQCQTSNAKRQIALNKRHNNNFKLSFQMLHCNSSQACRALNAHVLQNPSFKTRVITYYFFAFMYLKLKFHKNFFGFF
jgi:hypothetical protein